MDVDAVSVNVCMEFTHLRAIPSRLARPTLIGSCRPLLCGVPLRLVAVGECPASEDTPSASGASGVERCRVPLASALLNLPAGALRPLLSAVGLPLRLWRPVSSSCGRCGCRCGAGWGRSRWRR